MAAGRHRRRLSRWTRVRRAISGALTPLDRAGRHRRARHGEPLELLALRVEVAQLRRTVATLRAELEDARSVPPVDLRLALLLPLVHQTAQRAAAPTELEAFPRGDGIEEIVAAEKAVAKTTEIDLRPGRHEKVA